MSGLPNIPLGWGTAKQRANLYAYKQIIVRARDAPGSKVRSVLLAAFEMDRAPAAIFGPVVTYGAVPPLRTRGQAVFVISVADAEAMMPVVSRLLTLEERMRLQGHRGELAAEFSRTTAARVTGNAYAVPMLARVVVPLMAAVCDGPREQ